MKLRDFVWALTLATAVGLISTAGLQAQTPTAAQPPTQTRHIVDASALNAAVHDKIAADAANRDAILSAVRQPEAQTVATRLGLTPSRVDDAVQTMSPSEAAALAPTARMAADVESGGDISISLTALLLLLILLVLIVK